MKREHDRLHVDTIRERLDDPAELCDRLGVDLDGSQRQGTGLLVRCPSHGDRTPSCSITIGNDGTIRVRCFGCDLSGDVFNLIAAVEGVSVRSDFPRVLRRAAELAGVWLDDVATPLPSPRPRRPAPPPAPVVDLHPLVLPIAHLGRLADDNAIAEDVQAYLRGRGLLEEARAAGVFALPPAGPGILVDSFGLDLVVDAGLAKAGGRGWKWSAHRLCIPWRGVDGRIGNLQRRVLDGSSPRYVTPKGRTPPAPFGAEQLAQAAADAPIVIVEGALDALALRRLDAGSGRIVLGVQGVKGWLRPWDELARGRAVWIGFDADDEGDDAAPDIKERLLEAGAVSVKRLRPVGAKDWAAVLEQRAGGST